MISNFNLCICLADPANVFKAEKLKRDQKLNACLGPNPFITVRKLHTNMSILQITITPTQLSLFPSTGFTM